MLQKCDNNKWILGHPELSQESHEPLKTKRVLLLYDRFRERMHKKIRTVALCYLRDKTSEVNTWNGKQKMSEPKAMQFYSSHTWWGQMSASSAVCVSEDLENPPMRPHRQQRAWGERKEQQHWNVVLRCKAQSRTCFQRMGCHKMPLKWSTAASSAFLGWIAKVFWGVQNVCRYKINEI